MTVKRARVLVVGGSSGLGRSIGMGLASQGHRVAFLGRRLERLQEAAAEADPEAVALSCDVRDEKSCASTVGRAADALGGADVLLYCAGIGPLSRLSDTTARVWRQVLDTNVVGAALATGAALPHLSASGGRAIFLSSVSASHTPPWPGLGAYAVSKAALDKLVEAWRGECPEVRFTRLIVGESAGGAGPNATEFASGWDPELAAKCYPIWLTRGYLSGALVPVDQLVKVVATLVDIDVEVPSITITAQR
ncbi:MAG: SDR family oxidoreductase [Mycobacteriales bacterium]